ncbi:MAG: flippase-like domain-containing protein [Anaerolineaceae bacterium]|nr:flippase-like domain-containing protein [Anaerolineaceae bacterium]
MNGKVTDSNNVLIWRRLIPGLFLGFIVFLALVLIGDVRQVGDTLLKFRWEWFIPVLLLTTFNDGLRFIKWHYYVRQLGVTNVGWKESLRVFVGGFPLSVTPGKVGEALKGVWLNQASGLPVGSGVSVVVAERISDGLAVLVLSVFGVVAYPQYWPVFVFVLAALLAAVVISQIPPLALWFLALVEKMPVVRRFAGGLRDFYEGSAGLFKPVSTIAAVGIGSLSWMGEGIGLYVVLLGLGEPPGFRLLSLAIFVMAFSTVVGAVSALPGGLGAAEMSMTGMLVLLAGLDPAVASSATVLIRIGTLWFGVLLGLIVWAISPKMLGLRGNNGQSDKS